MRKRRKAPKTKQKHKKIIKEKIKEYIYNMCKYIYVRKMHKIL